MDETTAPSTVAAGRNAIGPERHVIAEGYRLVTWLGRLNFCLMTSGVVLKNEVGERLEIEVETVAKSAILQEFCIVWALLFFKLLNVKK